MHVPVLVGQSFGKVMWSARASARRTRLLVGLCVAAVATAGLLAVQAYLRPQTDTGLYFQRWSSEAMMQTVSIADLREEPLQSLWHLHIQPPAFDALRALLAQTVGNDDPQLSLRRVDRWLYVIWAIVYGVTLLVVFHWLAELAGPVFAAVTVLLFAVHPALVFYATLLDTTLVSALLFLWFCYLLWRIKEGRPVSAWILAAAFLGLFFTRAVFQWFWLLLLLPCLVLLRYPPRRLVLFMALTTFVTGLYTAKQVLLFGISTTTSFVGLNLCQSVNAGDTQEYYTPAGVVRAEVEPAPRPRVLSRVHKIDGTLNFNHARYLDINRRLQRTYAQHLRSTPLPVLARGILSNARIYLLPSSRYTQHEIADRLPWRTAYDRLLSFPALPLLTALAGAFWLLRGDRTRYRGAAGLALPVVFLALICILFERGENMRFKFFVEPVLLVFLASQAYGAGRAVLARWQMSAKS